MTINFFNTRCSEIAKTDEIFGICDDQNGTKAYTDTTDPGKWIALVKNENETAITFTAIDNCLIVFKESSKDKESSCDGMLTYLDSLFLIELKSQRTGGWIPEAIGQLESTIKVMLANHDMSSYRYKKAFICNKKRPNFHQIDHELNRKFFREYGFRIDIQDEIVIK